ncbi:uncharacterized protein LOC119615496 [Lucilia sericata]|uniref:uncharacterized protein LOC119608905 n=1 Tax=Lucilia sericata TaxID=13632 RepID=UPI0018A7FB16|nr:uncharacterized protein LOC119608905 [Lucilia sericata]XP_037827429.1 uncharacterized protein LOC119615496 [Lucilia sericata]
MLAARSLRIAATRYTHPALCVWSSNVRTIPILEATTTTWYTRPLAVAYSKDTKPGASLGDTGVKLPSKDQVESFFFKSLVYLWDFAYYVFCLSHKLVEKYVFNNSTVQHYWNLLLKRMDDARKEIKSK